jgi:hypothetical protein
MSDRTNAANTVTALVVGGILAIGLGTLLAVVEWPTDNVYGDAEGSALVAYVGLLLIGLGQLALFAAVVAWAVTIGVRWSGLTSEMDYIVRRAVGPQDGVQPLGPVTDRSYLDEDGR